MFEHSSYGIGNPWKFSSDCFFCEVEIGHSFGSEDWKGGVEMESSRRKVKCEIVIWVNRKANY